MGIQGSLFTELVLQSLIQIPLFIPGDLLQFFSGLITAFFAGPFYPGIVHRFLMFKVFNKSLG
jgi:hypothetical protein